MSEFKGTPGPWFWTEKNGQAVALMAAGGKWVADPQCDISDYGLRAFHWTDVSKEDAALIAAAPELLEACTDALDSMESVGVLVTGDMHKGDPAVEKLRAAIAKALGEGQ